MAPDRPTQSPNASFTTQQLPHAHSQCGRAQRIIELRKRYRVAASSIASSKAMLLVDLVCETPIVSSRAVEENLGVTRPTALKLLRQLKTVGVLEEGNLGPRGQRRYLARELMDAVTDDTGS